MLGLMVKKIGMTQMFDENGKSLGVTVLEVLNGVVSQLKTSDRDGYTAIQIAASEIKEKDVNKPRAGHFKNSGIKPCKFLKEFRTDKSGEFNLGDELNSSLLKNDDKVDLTGISIGKGFQGVMKRHNFAGGAATHGCSVSHRVPGSIGQCTTPGRVFKNKKMPGQMGNKQVTVKGIKVVAIDEEKSLVMVNGSVPGAKGSIAVLKNKDIEARFFESKQKPEPTHEGSEEKVA